jgi:hypothetical protein
MRCFSLDYLPSVLGIQLPQEAMGGSLIVNGHELCDPRTVRLNNGNTEPEGRKFLRTDSTHPSISDPPNDVSVPRDASCLKCGHRYEAALPIG